MSSEMEMFMSQVVPELQDLVESDGHYLVVVNFPHENDLQVAMLLSLLSLAACWVLQLHEDLLNGQLLIFDLWPFRPSIFLYVALFSDRF